MLPRKAGRREPSPVPVRRSSGPPDYPRSNRLGLHVEMTMPAEIEEDGFAFTSRLQRKASSIAPLTAWFASGRKDPFGASKHHPGLKAGILVIAVASRTSNSRRWLIIGAMP